MSEADEGGLGTLVVLVVDTPRDYPVVVARRKEKDPGGCPPESLWCIGRYGSRGRHDGSIALAHKGCGRAENGSPAPGGAFLPPAPPRVGQGAAPPPAAGGQGPQQNGAGSRDCVAGLENFNAALVAARRMPLIDEEAQVVLATGVFIRKPGSPTPRNAASWWFVIDEAKIRTTYTAMFYPPAGLAVPNWPPYHGNWPLPENAVPAPVRVP
jgi:hypothetical protein